MNYLKRITACFLLVMACHTNADAQLNNMVSGPQPEQQPAKAPKKYNIVFFLVDDLGWADVGYQGSKFHETPNIDKFSKKGVQFSQAYAACHVCSPTRASILTGQYPARLGLTDWLPGRKDFSFQKLKTGTTVQHLPYVSKTLPDVL